MENRPNSIQLPADLHEQIAKRVEQSDFASVEEYVIYVLQEIVKKTSDTDLPTDTYSAEEEANVKERLKGLGYLE